ncbi:4Fe-4S dicluster domain-containing protein [bacterium]|nr:4Fe-4S dicluster domain-containing protein [bacterium]
MDRRDFLKTGGLFLVGAPSVYGLLAVAAPRPGGALGIGVQRWGMVIDLRRCPDDCTACLDACRRENNVALHGDPRWDIHWIRKVKIRRKHDEHAPEKAVPLLCNHCDNPPCAQVCPVQATYKRADGIVIVDHHRCIGCRYCLIACPYNARYFNYRENEAWPNKKYPKRSHGVAESCHLCAHRLDVGESPACVEACRGVRAGALTVGDLNDPDSEISRLIAGNSVKRLRDDLGTEPKVFYIGL